MPQEAAAGSLPATSLQALRHWEGVAACGGRRSGQGVSYVAITGVGKPGGNPLVSSGPVGVWLSRVRASAATLTRPRAGDPSASREVSGAGPARAGRGRGLAAPRRAPPEGADAGSQDARRRAAFSPSVQLVERVSSLPRQREPGQFRGCRDDDSFEFQVLF